MQTLDANGAIKLDVSGDAAFTGSGVSGRVAEWASAFALQASSLVKSGAGLLALSAAGDYTLTVPATGTAALLGISNVFAATNTIQGGLNVGLATTAGVGEIYVESSSGSNPAIRILDGDVLQPFSAFPATFVGGFTVWSALAGGLNIQGVSDSDATGFGYVARVGATSTSAPAMAHRAGKHNGSGGTANLSDTEMHSRWEKFDGTALATLYGGGSLVLVGGLSLGSATNAPAGGLALQDGVTAPSATSGSAKIYVDTADGDLKVRFGDGTIKTLATDT